MDDVADVSEIHAASACMIEACKVGEFIYISDPLSKNNGAREEWGLVPLAKQ
jgi:hypothetical protein